MKAKNHMIISIFAEKACDQVQHLWQGFSTDWEIMECFSTWKNAAPIRPLAWEPPYAAWAAQEMGGKKKVFWNWKERRNAVIVCRWNDSIYRKQTKLITNKFNKVQDTKSTYKILFCFYILINYLKEKLREQSHLQLHQEYSTWE